MEVYRTKAACTIVKMIPGPRPSTEYEYGKDMMARQMYSEKSSAAVCENREPSRNKGVEVESYHLPAAGSVFDGAVSFHLNLFANRDIGIGNDTTAGVDRFAALRSLAGDRCSNWRVEAAHFARTTTLRFGVGSEAIVILFGSKVLSLSRGVGVVLSEHGLESRAYRHFTEPIERTKTPVK